VGQGGRSADEAVETLVELELVRARVHGDLAGLASVWFPLVVFGGLTLASAGAAASGGGAALGVFWVVASPLGLVLVWRHYARRSRRIGIAAPGGHAMFALGAALAVGTFAAGALFPPTGPAYTLAAGYLVMGRVARSRTMTLLGAATAAVTLALELGGVARLDIVLPALLGGALLLAGMASRP
jgi:hypothetical protein